MKIENISSMVGGWFIGDFEPSVLRTPDFEICVKTYSAGATEAKHFQKQALEVTVIVSGEAMLAGKLVQQGDIISIEPFEEASFEALTDVVLVAVKTPSIPSDKVLSE